MTMKQNNVSNLSQPDPYNGNIICNTSFLHQNKSTYSMMFFLGPTTARDNRHSINLKHWITTAIVYVVYALVFRRYNVLAIVFRYNCILALRKI